MISKLNMLCNLRLSNIKLKKGISLPKEPIDRNDYQNIESMLRSKSKIEGNNARVIKEGVLMESPTVESIEEQKVTLPKDEKITIFNLNPVKQLSTFSPL